MQMKKIQIHNCHTHIFTLHHLPTNFFIGFYWLAWLIEKKPTRSLILFLVNLIPGSFLRMLGARVPRIAAFLNICDNESQSEVFTNSLRHYYPSDTRFVVLPMDYTFMGYGKPKYDIDDQLEKLAKVRDDFPDQIIPFVHIDPRHKDPLERVKKWITEERFKGVKIYPSFGYYPSDARLHPIYEFCEEYENGIPVMTHCAGATLRAKEFKYNKEKASSYCRPSNYIGVLQKHPALRLCLGHFGGDRAWEAYLKKPLIKDRMNSKARSESGSENWLYEIIDMIETGSYPNLFVDIAYVIFHYEENINILKVLMESPLIRRSILFGTDYYMAEIENFSEKKLSMFLRAGIGEDYYEQIAEINPKRYLFGSSSVQSVTPDASG